MLLTRIIDPKQTADAVRKIERAFRNGAERFVRYVGFPGGRIQERIDWQAPFGCWLCRHDEWNGNLLNRYWLAFGVTPPHNTSSLPMTVQINLGRDGTSGRGVAGLLARDTNNKILVCHSGRLGGGRPGIGKTAFINWFSGQQVQITSVDGKSVFAYPIAELDSPRLVPQVCEYVRACAAFKAGAPPIIPSVPGSFGGAATESEERRILPARDGSLADCDHAIVRNRLNTLLSRAQYRTSRDQLRDIIIGDPTNPDAELEIKSSADPQCIYAGVGQLLVHSTMKPADKRILVLPSPVPNRYQKSLRSLGVELLEYRWTTSTLHFEGLRELFPGTESHIPIAP